MVSVRIRREIEAMGHVLGTFEPVMDGHGTKCIYCGGAVYVDDEDRVAKDRKLVTTCAKRVIIKRRDL